MSAPQWRQVAALLTGRQAAERAARRQAEQAEAELRQQERAIEATSAVVYELYERAHWAARCPTDRVAVEELQSWGTARMAIIQNFQRIVGGVLAHDARPAEALGAFNLEIVPVTEAAAGLAVGLASGLRQGASSEPLNPASAVQTLSSPPTFLATRPIGGLLAHAVLAGIDGPLRDLLERVRQPLKADDPQLVRLTMTQVAVTVACEAVLDARHSPRDPELVTELLRERWPARQIVDAPANPQVSHKEPIARKMRDAARYEALASALDQRRR